VRAALVWLFRKPRIRAARCGMDDPLTPALTGATGRSLPLFGDAVARWVPEYFLAPGSDGRIIHAGLRSRATGRSIPSTMRN
jgi:hypothetical protein